MRALLSWLFPSRTRLVELARGPAGAGRWAAGPAISPAQVRGQRFRPAGVFAGGLDPIEVHRYLDRLADEIGSLREDVARTHQENVRIKCALRDWQARAAHNQPARW